MSSRPRKGQLGDLSALDIQDQTTHRTQLLGTQESYEEGDTKQPRANKF